MQITSTEIHKELDLVQGIVTRMAQNSFQVKAWLIAVLGGMIAFLKNKLVVTCCGAKDMVIIMDLLLLLPILCFWYLDAFFLSTERLYRELYKWVVKYRSQTDLYLYDLNTFVRTVNGVEENLIKKENRWTEVMYSKTLRPFYLVPLLLVIGLVLFNLIN